MLRRPTISDRGIPFDGQGADQSSFERLHVEHDFLLITEECALPSPGEALEGLGCKTACDPSGPPWDTVILSWPDGGVAVLHAHVRDEPRPANLKLIETFSLKRIAPEEERYFAEGTLEFGIMPVVEEESARTLQLVQQMARVVDRLQQRFGGVVADLKQFALYGAIWSSPSSSEYTDFLRFVNVHQVLTRDGIWAHTHGMAHFGKPDVEAVGVPIELEEEYARWLLDSCWHQATVEALEAGDAVEDPVGRTCALEPASEVAGRSVADHYLNECLRVVSTE